jgi:hypothetical protein
MSEKSDSSESPAAGWRFKLGAAMFGLSILLPLAGVPLVTALGLSTGVTASVSGGLLLSVGPSSGKSGGFLTRPSLFWSDAGGNADIPLNEMGGRIDE